MADKLCEPEYGSNLAMERFLDTPMDEYPADLSTIEKAASKLSLGEQTPRFEPYPRRRSYARSNGSSCSSLGSASTHSIHSFYSFDSRPSRRGRRKIIGADLGMPIANHSPGETKLFYCTFCPKSFPGRYEWNRHEEAVHIPRKVWVCNVYENHRGPPGNFCPYCDETNPSSSHLEEHKHTRCGLRPEADRTFLRKDHLKQHLLHFHGCSSYSLALTTVNSFQKALGPIDLVHPALHCGFCGFHALDWEERVEHIATHFKAGVDLLEWWLQRNKSSHESHQVQCVLFLNLTNLLLTHFEGLLRIAIVICTMTVETSVSRFLMNILAHASSGPAASFLRQNNASLRQPVLIWATGYLAIGSATCALKYGNFTDSKADLGLIEWIT